MNDKPLVTIISSTFNILKAGREAFFRQSLESIHNQTYGNIEHIIVDGGSKDGTVDLIKEYADKGWVRYVSEPDQGIYDAMNKGVKMAHGKYVAFINSDDYYHRDDGVEKSIALLEKEKAVFSYAPVVNLDKRTGYKDLIYPDISNIFFSITPNHQTMFVRRKEMIDLGLFDMAYKNVAEYDLNIRLCLNRCKSVFLDYDFVTYRLGGNSFEAAQRGKLAGEVCDIYYKNYNQICPLTKDECCKICGDIFHADCRKVPLKLAKGLKKYKPYFDYDKYSTVMSVPAVSIRKKAADMLNTLKRRTPSALKSIIKRLLRKIR